MDPTNRFTNRVADYVRYRPHYPDAVLEIVREECGLLPAWRVADIGSGTGFLTELFLANGNPTWGVEPNAAMRQAGEEYLAGYPHFTSVDGTAEATTLPDASIELVAAGQAFHWFQVGPARAEFRRILRPAGWVALVWNDRRTAGTPFLEAYEELLREFALDYAQVNHRRIDDQVLSQLFAGPYRARSVENRQQFDLEGQRGRLLSSSYAPAAGQPRHAEMLANLDALFAKHERGGSVIVEYDTLVYVGRV